MFPSGLDSMHPYKEPHEIPSLITLVITRKPTLSTWTHTKTSQEALENQVGKSKTASKQAAPISHSTIHT